MPSIMQKMLYFILLLHILLVAEASLINKTPIKVKKPMKYIGPVVYSNLPPPIVYFPPAPEIPKNPYTAAPSRPVQFVPFPYNELPVLIYRSKHNPPIHVVNQNKLVSQNSVGESNPHYKDYSPDTTDDLIAEGSETVKTRIATKSPFRTLFEQKPIYIESPPPPKPIYVSPSRNVVRRQKGTPPAGRPKIQNMDLDTSDSKIKIKTFSGPKFSLTKAYVSQKQPLFDFMSRPVSISRPISIHTKKDYLGDLLSTILGGITSTTHNINKFFGIRRPNSRITSLRDRVKEYKLRKMLGLKSPRFHYLSGYGNQAIDPEFASLLSEQITQSFLDELGNYASHGRIKITATKAPKMTESKPLLPSESIVEYSKHSHKVPPTTSTASPSHKKPPIIIFQGIRPPIYVYRKPVSQIYDDSEVIKPPLPYYKPPQALHEQPPPIYKTRPFSPLSISKVNEDDDKSSLIISSNNDKVWQPVLKGEESKDVSIIDISNHKVDSSEQYYKD